MAEAVAASPQESTKADGRLAILLAMAMFVLVVDTSIMNVSISAVVADIGTTVSGVPVRDRARGAGVGRVHPARQQDRRPHRPQTRVCTGTPRLRGRRAGHDADPVPPADHHLLGGHRRPRCVAPAALDAVPHPRQLRGRRPATRLRARWARRRPSPRRSVRSSAGSSRPSCPGASRSSARPSSSAVVLAGLGLVRDVAYTGERQIDLVGGVLSIFGMGGIVLGILAWQEGGEPRPAPARHRRRRPRGVRVVVGASQAGRARPR